MVFVSMGALKFPAEVSMGALKFPAEAVCEFHPGNPVKPTTNHGRVS